MWTEDQTSNDWPIQEASHPACPACGGGGYLQMHSGWLHICKLLASTKALSVNLFLLPLSLRHLVTMVTIELSENVMI